MMRKSLPEDVANSIEETFALLALCRLGKFSRQLLEELFLAARQFHGRLDDDSDDLIAPPHPIDIDHTLTAKPDGRSGLSTRRHSESMITLERRHLDLRSERGLRNRYRDLAVDIIALPLEEGVLLDRDHHVEIAGGSIAESRFPLTRNAQTGTILHAGRNSKLEDLLFLNHARTAALTAGLLDDAARPVAGGTGSADCEKALLKTNLPPPVAGRTDRGSLLGVGARSLTLLAGSRLRNLDLGFGPEDRILEIDLQVITQVGPSL